MQTLHQIIKTVLAALSTGVMHHLSWRPGKARIRKGGGGGRDEVRTWDNIEGDEEAALGRMDGWSRSSKCFAASNLAAECAENGGDGGKRDPGYTTGGGGDAHTNKVDRTDAMLGVLKVDGKSCGAVYTPTGPWKLAAVAVEGEGAEDGDPSALLCGCHRALLGAAIVAIGSADGLKGDDKK
ncbi:hypothetical protein N2152v2_005757 [Parachlorella kessleri]